MENNTRIYLEENPNPNSLKFVANYMLVPEGEIFDYPDIEAANKSPLATSLFQNEFVERIFIMNNFITITKNEDVQWDEIQDQLKQDIIDYLNSDKPVILDDKGDPVNMMEDESEIELKIRNILDEYVKPVVEQDGGAISFHSYQDGVVKVLLQGACSGCPSSTITLKNGIENLLTSMIPEVKMVEAEGI